MNDTATTSRATRLSKPLALAAGTIAGVLLLGGAATAFAAGGEDKTAPSTCASAPRDGGSMAYADDRDDDGDDDGDGDGGGGRDDDRVDPASVDVPRSAAVRLAQQKAGAEGATVHEVNLVEDDARAVWNVELSAGGAEHEVDIDADSGEVLAHEADRDDRADDGHRDDDGTDDSKQDEHDDGNRNDRNDSQDSDD